MDMNEIKEIFFQECEEQLAELESGLLRLNDGDTDPETVNAVFRAVHSIKGGAGAFGLDDLVSFAHVFETTLDCVRSNKLEASQDLLKVMLRSADVLADLTAASRDGGTVESSRTSGLVAELEAYANGQPLPTSAAAPAAAAPEPVKTEAPAPAAEAPEPTDDSGFQPVPFSFDALDGEDDLAVDSGRSVFTVRFKPRSDLYAKGNEAVLILRELAKLGDLQVRCETDDLPSLDMLDPEGAYFSWLIRVETESNEEAIRHVFEFVEWDSTVEITAGADEEAFAAPAASGEDQPMAAVPFDLSLLEDQPAVPAEAAAPRRRHLRLASRHWLPQTCRLRPRRLPKPRKRKPWFPRFPPHRRPFVSILTGLTV